MSNISYWEFESYFKNMQDVVLGGGIVGLSTAYFLSKKYPQRRIVVVERDPLSAGASTKNAGFACYGSPSEILSDLEKMTKEEVIELVRLRYEGLLSLRNLLGDDNIGYIPCGGMELFRSQDSLNYDKCADSLNDLNLIVREAIGYGPYSIQSRSSFEHFEGFIGAIFNRGEGSIHTGKMIRSLKDLCIRNGVEFMNGLNVTLLDCAGVKPKLVCDDFSFSPERLFVCVNGFARKLMPELEVTAVRNQVVVTNILKNSIPECTYHLDEGYVYFRPINGRVLIGGFRNIDFENETTDKFGLSDKIQDKLESFIRDYITKENFSIDFRWSGILGVGSKKSPIIKQYSENVFVGVRMGGMGVAIGNLIGKKLADLAN